jgi:ribose 5-phosphate isomerase A
MKIHTTNNKFNLNHKIHLPINERKTFVTDSGNAIIDVTIGHIPEPRRLDNLIKSIPGVVDHGLFIDICGIILMGTDDGVQTFRKG